MIITFPLSLCIYIVIKCEQNTIYDCNSNSNNIFLVENIILFIMFAAAKLHHTQNNALYLQHKTKEYTEYYELLNICTIDWFSFIIKHWEICDVGSRISISVHEIHISHYIMLMGKVAFAGMWRPWRLWLWESVFIHFVGVMNYKMCQ